ncbi:hypothetical protein E4H12_00765 [Candidatus Thorarchaeota archaeon]|nr:MAG: hypothetical protein E4H12_00765 [Candidatus Thorarchaeota archaeon]
MKANTDKQKLLVEYLISSPDTFALCKSIVRADYFEPGLRKAVDFIHDYYDKYNTIPSADQISAETGSKLKPQQITRDQIAYCTNEIESFCKRQALTQAVFSAPDLIEKGDYGTVEAAVREALLVSLNRNLGVDYFYDPLGRLELMSQTPLRTPTTWHQFDDLLFGGLARTEMLLFSANSGGGKSITLANLAMNFVMQKMNVLYITLELSEQLVAQRFDTMFTGVPTVMWQQNYKEIAAMLSVVTPNAGNLVIKHMPSGTNCNSIRAYLKEFELKNNYVPDLLIVDYLDMMGANEKVSADNVWEKDKRATEQLRDIGFDYNFFIATASQQNRAALDADEVHQGHIAGGISKVNTVDIHVSIILNSSMKASGEIGFLFLKTRNSDGVGKTIYLRWDNTRLRIINPKEDLDIDGDGVILNKVAHTKGKSAKRSLNDLMDL